jgi:hexokinase
VKLIALVNDTTGALVASHYNDSETIIGAIFGTGCNAAYMENAGSIPKLSSLSDDTPMAINCEYGAFDNSHKVLPRTKYDEQIDAESPRPGEQTFEKMSAGLYLGEIYRLILLDLHEQGVLFKNQDVAKLRQSYAFDTALLSALENDDSTDQQDSVKQFEDFGISPAREELPTLRHLAEIVTVRGARLCSTGVASICRKKGIKKGHIAADGSVANKHPHFKQRWSEALGEILDWKKGQEPIVMTSAEDGSGVGAAVIAALAIEKGWCG